MRCALSLKKKNLVGVMERSFHYLNSGSSSEPSDHRLLSIDPSLKVCKKASTVIFCTNAAQLRYNKGSLRLLKRQ